MDTYKLNISQNNEISFTQREDGNITFRLNSTTAILDKEKFEDFVSVAIKCTDTKIMPELLLKIAKHFFYEGFEKCDKDDANCFTAWRESTPLLYISNFLNKTYGTNKSSRHH